jgi:hypothetical protein
LDLDFEQDVFPLTEVFDDWRPQCAISAVVVLRPLEKVTGTDQMIELGWGDEPVVNAVLFAGPRGAGGSGNGKIELTSLAETLYHR